MDHGGDLNEDAPRIEEMAESKHSVGPVTKMFRLPRMVKQNVEKK
jgi:hypothetical protein